MMSFSFLDFFPVMPEIAIAIMTFLLLLVGAFKGEEFFASQIRMSILTLVFAFALAILCFKGTIGDAFYGMFHIDKFVMFNKFIIIIGAAVVLFMSAGFYRSGNHKAPLEFPALILLAVLGMMLMVSANNFMSMYVGIELQSLTLYVLAAMHRDDSKSSESGLKYFVLGAVASALLLYGISLIYGFSGTLSFEKLRAVIESKEYASLGVLVGLVLVICALAFKLAAVPFHMWAPDVYEGAPTPVTSFFAIAPKVAAVALFTRFLEFPFAGMAMHWQQIIIVISALSMIVGALGALRQKNIKRLMAYSSIGHVGYVLVGVASASQEGVKAVLLYLVIYMVMSLGVFAIIMMMRYRDNYREDIVSLAGISKSNPMMALLMAILMFSMAGIPPFAGFFGKFFIFFSAINAGLIPLAILGLLSSVISAFYYLRIVKIMYFDEVSVSFDKVFQPEVEVVALISSGLSLLFFLISTPVLLITTISAASLF